jgi:outer membrane murein-binding lipoprotein Lpp
VPISQNTSYPVEKRAKSVKTSADKIAAASGINTGSFDKGITALTMGVLSLNAKITYTEKSVKEENEAALDKLSEKIDELAAKIKADGQLFQRLSARSKMLLNMFKTPKKDDPTYNRRTPSSKKEPPTAASNHMKKDTKKDDEEATKKPRTDKYKRLFDDVQVVGSFFEAKATHSTDKKTLDAAVEKLSALRHDADVQIHDLKQAGTEIQGLITKFNGLVWDLGDFAVVWKKLANDAALLSEYIAMNGLDETTIAERVVAESQVYNKIKRALDEYCLRTR